MKQVSLLAILVLLVSWVGGCMEKDNQKSASIPDRIDFNFHVRPILSDRCYACHGPDAKARKADLRLDNQQDAFAALDSSGTSFAIVPGSVKSSVLVNRIESTDGDYQMPPPDSKLSLSPREIEILKRWIKQGAEWKPHWAFTPPQKPDLPGNRVTGSEIDLFIQHRLTQEGLAPAVEASKEKLIRRLSFDLRGLPPTLEEIDAFLADESSDAYEKLVDRFLSEDTYGERLAMEWLDLARYADSHGYQDDIERSMWPWRDWVIDAFNQNIPYDSFVTVQLAGDLLPDATYLQKLATGFNRNHKITQEVGVIDEEYRVTYVLDRVNTFATAFMGLTVECAQCHDHKYDPISQKEYYRLFGFFNNVPEKGRVDYGVEVAEPSLPLPPEKIQPIKTYVQDLLKSQSQKVRAYAAKVWAEGYEPNLPLADSARTQGSIPEGLVAWFPFDYIENDQLEEVKRHKNAAVINELVPVTGKHGGAIEFMGTNYANLDALRTFNFNNPFSLSFWINSLDGGIRGPVLAALSDSSEANFLVHITNDKTLDIQWNNLHNETTFRLLSRETLPGNTWAQVTVTYADGDKQKGVKLYLDGQLLDPYLQKDNLRGSIPASSSLLLGMKPGREGLMAGQLDELMIFNRALTEAEIQQLIYYDPVGDLLSQKSRSPGMLKRLFYHHLTHEDPTYQALTERWREYKIREGRTEDIVLKPTMIMADMDTARRTFILNRGQYDVPGEQVHPGTPEAVLPFSESLAENRLGLARWLFDTKNPLTARVAVNRYWQMIFGRGLVATPGDFGSQGSLPSHPDLLDWLAVEFRESGWDLKKLLKKLVMSATYRQEVRSNKELQQKDPENILLARGPQSRLPAEMVRDQALASSGLLSNQLGGPSVKPYQPKGLWLEVASGNQSLRKYIQGHGDELYRRSLYTFWKRTVPPPSMTIFDAPSREQCIIKRGATSTPMQALVMLNDPQFNEASRLLAVSMLAQTGTSREKQIELAFRRATSRSPSDQEIGILLDLLEEEITEFEADPQAAAKLVAVGEYTYDGSEDLVQLAAYSVLANTILNLTEAIMKG